MYIARNRKEVVLSAGVISSPQILILSGIGPREHLKSLGISVVQDLPVEKILREHTLSPLIISLNVSASTECLKDSVENLLKGEGPLTIPLASDAVGWYRTPAEREENYHDVEMFFLNFSSGVVAKRTFAYPDETYDAINASVPNPFAILFSVLHAKSKRSITLTNSDPFEYPSIDPNLFSDDRDVETLYESVEVAKKLLGTEAFRSGSAIFEKFRV